MQPDNSLRSPLPAPLEGGSLWGLGRTAGALVPVGLLVLAAVALAVDVPLARWFASRTPSGIAADALQLAEWFGHGLGVLLILTVVAVLDPAHRRVIPRLLVASLGAGLTADVFKALLERTRPNSLTLDSISVWQSFGDWFPLISHGPGGHSFPSAHTATAAGLAVLLSVLYPRGRGLFLILTVAVGFQRIAVLAHFASDVLVGGLVGGLWGSRCVRGFAGRWFTWLETRGENPGLDHEAWENTPARAQLRAYDPDAADDVRTAS